MARRNGTSLLRRMLRRFCALVGAVGLTLAFFLVLPLMQTIGRPPEDDMMVRTVDAGNVPPPPPPPEPEPEDEPEPEEEPPEFAEEEAQPLDLSALEVALNPGFSDAWLGGDFAVNLNTVTAGAKDSDALFTMADLDQKPRVIYQPGPTMTPALRRKTPGKVVIIFIVDERGSVERPMVQSSSDPVFERPALAAVKQWKFDPGKRNGKPVRFRMRLPMTFPK
jgi:protein TonB